MAHNVNKKKFMIVDGHNLFNRAYYATPLLTNKAGEYTNAVHGFMNMLFRFLDEEKPDYFAVAFDLPQPTFRDKMFADYKGTRHDAPEEMKAQFAPLRRLLELMNVPIATLEGYEADDVMGTLAKRAAKMNIYSVIVSGDRDLLQCADDNIKIRVPKSVKDASGKLKTVVFDYDAAKVKDEFGVTPEQYIAVKALMGDASDNIPGVSGIGEKTAFKIIQQYGGLEEAIADASNVKPPRAGTNLKAEAETARLSYKLAKIDTDAPIVFDIEQGDAMNIYTPEARKELERLELRVLTKRFSERSGETGEHAQSGEIIMTENEAADFLSKLTGETTFDITYPDKAADCRVSFAVNGVVTTIQTGDATETCRTFFESDIPKATKNAKRAEGFLYQRGITLNNVVFDISLANYLLEQDDEDATADGLRQTLTERGLDSLYYDVEYPLWRVLADMERVGVAVDGDFLRSFGLRLDERLTALTTSIHAHAGEAFNINSPKQLGEILFDKMRIGGVKKSAKQRSTAAEVLEGLVGEHPIVSEILEYRTYSKLKSTYADGLLAVIGEDGRVRSTFNQTLTATGRLSSSEPNLQNIPVRTELGRQLRAAFVPRDGFVFVDADYSQIELRLLAHLSGDESFIKAFNDGADIHRLTASEAFGVALDDVTAEQRSAAKAVNFGIIYGMSAFRLGNEINVSTKEAERFIKDYFARYPKVKGYLDNAVESARSLGHATTLFGRTRKIPELFADNFNTRSFGERAAMNMPVQGTAADIIKAAMVRVWRGLKERGLKSRLILQIHDELLVEAAPDEVETVKNLLVDEMEHAADLSVKLAVDVHVGKNWLEAK